MTSRNNLTVSKQTHVFCHSRLRNQSLTLNSQNFQTDKPFYKQIHSKSNKSLIKSFSIYTNNFTNHHIINQTVNVITRNKPLIETSIRPIVRRYRGPNKKKITTSPHNGKLNDKSFTSNHKHANRRKRQPRERNSNISTQQLPRKKAGLQKTPSKSILRGVPRGGNQTGSFTNTNNKDDTRQKLGEPEEKNKYFHSLRKDLVFKDLGCMLYENKLVIPRNLKQLVIDAIHQTHPGQTGIQSLGNLLWFRCIHQSLTSKAQSCEQCTNQGKNLKTILTKQHLGKRQPLSEPNEEVQTDLAGPIPFKNHTDNYHILVSVDRNSGFPTSQVYKIVTHQPHSNTQKKIVDSTVYVVQ